MIVVVGVFLFLSINRVERRRQSAMEDVPVGTPATDVTGMLGVAPQVCPSGPLDHLRESFSEGWSPAAIDVALERLQAQTVERWVYRLGEVAVVCTGSGSRTELGVGPDGRVVWSVAVLGRSVIQLPPNVTPSGVDSLVAGQGS